MKTKDIYNGLICALSCIKLKLQYGIALNWYEKQILNIVGGKV